LLAFSASSFFFELPNSLEVSIFSGFLGTNSYSSSFPDITVTPYRAAKMTTKIMIGTMLNSKSSCGVYFSSSL